jgi:hypothetical protein
MNKKTTIGKMEEREYLSLFIIMVPTLIIAMASSIDSVIIRLGIQIISFLLQFVVVRNLLKDVYHGSI